MNHLVRLLGAQIAIACPALAYKVTKYFEPSVVRLTDTWDGSLTTFGYTTSAEVTLTRSATPSIITASTTIVSDIITVVEALIPTGFGEVVDKYAVTYDMHYYVEITMTHCIVGNSSLKDPITSTERIYLATELSGHMTPTTIIGTTSILAPSDLHPLDLAEASYSALPRQATECSPVLNTFDYRFLCPSSTASKTNSRASATTSNPTATSSVEADFDNLQCVELNPCCYGCHGWGWTTGVIVYDIDEWICEDGRHFFINGTERNMTSYWERKEKQAREAAAKASTLAEPTATGESDPDSGGARTSIMATPYLVAMAAMVLVITIL